MNDRVWCSIKPRIVRPWGSALKPEHQERIITPALITEPTRRITRPELRKAIDGEKA